MARLELYFYPFSLERTRARTHSQVFQRSFVLIELRFITVRFDEGLTPRQISVSEQAEGGERGPGKDFLSIR